MFLNILSLWLYWHKVAIQATRAVLQAIAAGRTDNNDRMQIAIAKISGPIMQQPTFNWEAEEK